MATIPNFFRQEFMVNDVPWRDACLSHPLPVEQGYFILPDRPVKWVIRPKLVQ